MLRAVSPAALSGNRGIFFMGCGMSLRINDVYFYDWGDGFPSCWSMIVEVDGLYWYIDHHGISHPKKSGRQFVRMRSFGKIGPYLRKW